MSLSLQRLTLPAFTRGLRVLALYLDKAAAHAAARGIAEDSLVNARLVADMLPSAILPEIPSVLALLWLRSPSHRWQTHIRFCLRRQP